MTECERTTSRLPGYLDGALPADEQDATARHLGACPPCRREADAQRAAAELVRLSSPTLRQVLMPPGLETRCRAAAREALTPRPRRSWLARLAPAALAVVMIAVTGGVLFAVATERSDTLLAAQLAADHEKCFRFFAPAEGTTVEPRAVEATLRQRFGWNGHVPGSSDADGLRLGGARRCVYADGSIPHVMYRAHGQNLSLFILSGVRRHEADLTVFGHRSRIWTEGDTTFVLVSSSAGGDMLDVATHVRQDAH